MKQKYDLTTKSGIDKALMVLEGINNPLGFALKYLKDLLSSNDPDKQAEIVKKLIETGRKQGVDEMEITLKNTKGFKLDIPLDDIKINTMLGSDGKVHLKVKFNKEEPNHQYSAMLTSTENNVQKKSFFANKTNILITALILLLMIVCIMAGIIITKL